MLLRRNRKLQLSKMAQIPSSFFIFIVLIATLSVVVSPLTSPADVAALKAFKSKIAPSSIPPFSCLATWNFSVDPCASPQTTHFLCGLQCSSDATRVTSITLDSAGYKGELSPLLSNLHQLEVLDLSSNSFYGCLPASVSSLFNLRSLSLARNSLSCQLHSSLFRNLTVLETLDLSFNRFSGEIPPFFFLKNLQRVDVSFNSFRGTLPKLSKRLIQFAAKGNVLSGPLLESSFDGLDGLEVIELSGNRITGKVAGWIFDIKGLQQVNLANNSLTSVEVGTPKGGNSVVAVDLGFNVIEGGVPVNFAHFGDLASLSLRYNKLSGVIPKELCKGRLRRLFLDGNYLVGKVPKGLVGLEAGSLGDNCFKQCPTKMEICKPLQKSVAICEKFMGRRD